MKNLLLLLTLFTCFFLAACSSRFSAENFTQIKNGMPMQEVKRLLGEPNEVATGDIAGLSGTVFTYKSPKGEGSITFDSENKVILKVGSFQDKL